MVYELNCQYDSRKSFYGKALVEECSDGSKVLYSYNTKVAEIDKDGNIVQNGIGQYSATTTRHVKEFFRQNGVL